MDLLDSTTSTWEWIKVPSHVDIPGNTRADELAAQGRKSFTALQNSEAASAPPPPPRDTPGLANAAPESSQPSYSCEPSMGRRGNTISLTWCRGGFLNGRGAVCWRTPSRNSFHLLC